MKRLLLLPAILFLFSYTVRGAVGDIVKTTINFSEVEAIQDCTEPNSITTFTVGDFTFEFTPGKEENGQSLCYKDFSEYGYGKAIYFWLGDVKYNGSTSTILSTTPGDAVKITNNKGHYITKVTVTVLDIEELEMFTTFFTRKVGNSIEYTNEKNNSIQNSNVFYHQSPVCYPGNSPYVAITSMEITTEVTEETEDPTPVTPPVEDVDEDEFAIMLDNITFEEREAGKSLMNFKLTVYNPGNVSKYLMVVSDPDDSTKEYYRGTFDGNSFPNADQPQGAPAKAPTTSTINGRVPLDNLKTDDDTPIAISITPQYETYTHADTPTVPKSTATGANEAIANDSYSRVQYYNLNGTRVARPTPGTPYIKRSGKTTRKIVIR